MKLNTAGKDMWLRTQTPNQKLKQSATTQDADSMKVLPVLCMNKEKAISQVYCISWEDGGNGSDSPALNLPLRLRPRDMLRPKTKTVWHLPYSYPVNFCQWIHTLLLYKDALHIVYCSDVLLGYHPRNRCLHSAINIFALIEVCSLNLANFYSCMPRNT